MNGTAEFTGTADTESVLGGVLDRWKAGVDAHEPERVAEVFTREAIFQGTHPYSVGREGVAAYYASQPLGMVAHYRIVETRRPAPDLALGFFDVEFTYVDKKPLPVRLGVLCEREADSWRISYYHVSPRI
jgi:uncharacterized protein (TIGR02246 family)